MGSLRVVAAVIAIGASAAAVRAQPAVNEKQRQQAGDLVKRAIAKSQAGNHGDAIDLYLQAYAIAPLPILLSNIGSEYQQQNKPVEALKYFCKYLDEDPNGTNVTYATAQAKTLQIQLGHPVNDDKDVCKPPEPAPPPPPPPGPGPGPGPGATPPPGSPEGGATTVTGTAALPGPSDTGAGAQPGRTLRLSGLAVGAVGVVAFGVGCYYGYEAKQISDDITSHKITDMWRKDIQAYEAEGQTDEDRQILFMVAGGVVAAGGGVMYWLGHRRGAEAEHVAVVPTGSATSVGFAVRGGF